jgi:hypothetical protein
MTPKPRWTSVCSPSFLVIPLQSFGKNDGKSAREQSQDFVTNCLLSTWRTQCKVRAALYHLPPKVGNRWSTRTYPPLVSGHDLLYGCIKQQLRGTSAAIEDDLAGRGR